jgi:DNA-binding response OmpR family regulator
MRLLLAEDDYDLVLTLKKDLQAAGYAVDLADNGIDAEHLGNENIYDIAVLDIGLPQRNGLEVLKNWRNADN